MIHVSPSFYPVLQTDINDIDKTTDQCENEVISRINYAHMHRARLSEA